MSLGPPSPAIARYAGAAAALAIFLLISALYLWAPFDLYMWVVRHYAINPYELPFLDSAGSLAALECARRGIDVVVRDPCDILERNYEYGPIWMSLSWLPLYMHHHFWFGWLSGAVFLVSLGALPAIPCTWRAVLLTVMASASSSVAYAVERANPDIWIFATVVGVVVLVQRGLAARCVGYVLAWCLAAFKYYPLVLCVLVVRERPRIAAVIGACLATATLIYIAVYFGDIVRGVPRAPSADPDSGMIGASNLPRGLEMLALAMASNGYAPAWAGLATRIVVAGALLAGTLWMVARWHRAPGIVQEILTQEAPRQLFLIAGAILIVGCFFAGQSIPYRAIFLLLVLPGILALGTGSPGHPLARMRDNLAGLIVFLLWEPLVRASFFEELTIIGIPQSIDVAIRIAYLVFRELAWWSIVAFLMTMLLIILARAPAIRALRLPFVLGLTRDG